MFISACETNHSLHGIQILSIIGKYRAIHVMRYLTNIFHFAVRLCSESTVPKKMAAGSFTHNSLRTKRTENF